MSKKMSRYFDGYCNEEWKEDQLLALNKEESKESNSFTKRNTYIQPVDKDIDF